VVATPATTACRTRGLGDLSDDVLEVPERVEQEIATHFG